ncbi:MAG TPA: hypothetical protein VMT57_05670 [Candidatus Thermoplasmatota archaeon]|nr:hypothetical protein [Candidatus Thermoplasmatota archaeon]
MIKKLVIFGSLCCLMVLSMAMVPMVKADGEFPYGQGPYKVYLVGKCDAVGNSYLFALPHKDVGGQIGPFCAWKYPYGPDYDMYTGAFLVVNGQIVTPDMFHSPVDVYLYGFKGFSPSTFLFLIKGFIPTGELRVFGVADAIDLHSE